MNTPNPLSTWYKNSGKTHKQCRQELGISNTMWFRMLTREPAELIPMGVGKLLSLEKKTGVSLVAWLMNELYPT